MYVSVFKGNSGRIFLQSKLSSSKLPVKFIQRKEDSSVPRLIRKDIVIPILGTRGGATNLPPTSLLYIFCPGPESDSYKLNVQVLSLYSEYLSGSGTCTLLIVDLDLKDE